MKSEPFSAHPADNAAFAPRAGFVVAAAGPLLGAVVAQSGLPDKVARAAIDDGAVYVDGRRCRDRNLKLRPGQMIKVLAAAPAARRKIDAGQLHVVHRDERLLIVAKPAGLPTQPPPRGGDALSLRVARLLGPQAYVGEVHRLDRDASGLVAYALDKAAAARVAAQFRDHSARRRYLAVVRSQLAVHAQTIDEPIGEIAVGRMATAANGVPAVTVVRPLAFDAVAGMALLDLQLRTGRSHQIRVHLAWAVGPICGDFQYGDRSRPGQLPAKTPRIALHGGALALQHPEGAHLHWTLPPPPDFWPSDSALLAARLPDHWPAA